MKNHLHLLTQEQINWCNRHVVQDWWVDSKGEVEVEKDLSLKLKGKIETFPVQFADVKGDFYCGLCVNLTSLKGAPREVKGDFDCNNCTSLTSIEGAPKKVGGDFKGSFCTSLTSLEGAPEKVGGKFQCYSCTSLTSLKGAPRKARGDFDFEGCTSLDSFSAALAEDKELLKKWLKLNPRPSPKEFLHDKRGLIHGKKFGI